MHLIKHHPRLQALCPDPQERDCRGVQWEVEGEVEKFTNNQKMILGMIEKNPFVSKKEMSETVGIRSSSIDENITTLKEKGHLKRVGSAKGGHWEILK